jgi:mRNA interferase MazF
MGKPVAGEVVVVPLPQTDLTPGKRRPALVVADLPGDDVILCQITSQARTDGFEVPLCAGDFAQGRLQVDSYIRTHRLFTVDHSKILYSAARVSGTKLGQVRAKIRALFA